MLGSLFFESTSNSLGVDDSFEVNSHESQFEFKSNTGLSVESESVFENVVLSNGEINSSLTTQNYLFGEPPFSVTSSELNLQSNGIRMTEQSNSFVWNGGSLVTTTSQVETSALQGDFNQTETSLVAEIPLDLNSPPELNVATSQMVFEGNLGSLVINQEAIAISGPNSPTTTSMQSSTTEWSYTPSFGGLQLGGSISSVEINPEPVALIQPEGCAENAWIQNAVETSVSLDFGASATNSPGNLLGGLTSTQSRTAIQMGPEQLTLETQTIDMFSRFAGPNTAMSWLSQTQSTLDMSLAIA